jgi:hypothetical protein
MPRRVQRPAPGYEFEDLTAAWLIVKMLRGGAIPGIDDLGEKLQMQTNTRSWRNALLPRVGVISGISHGARHTRSQRASRSAYDPAAEGGEATARQNPGDAGSEPLRSAVARPDPPAFAWRVLSWGYQRVSDRTTRNRETPCDGGIGSSARRTRPSGLVHLGCQSRGETAKRH